jgi:HAD superfamily hydrolase (TIGR01509 family)
MAEYQDVRLNSAATVLPGIPEILSDLEERGILRAVVSNNPVDEIIRILTHSGINDRFVHVQGNDTPGLKNKPAPDTYLAAARALGIAPENCCVVEDSLRGARAGKDAGCFVVGVATGADPVSDLENAGWLDRVYASFGRAAVSS